MRQRTRTELAASLVARFPNTPSLTLAKKLYKENVSLFTTLEAARSVIRRVRGADGERERKRCSVKENYRAPRQAGDVFGSLPKGLTDFNDWQAFDMGGKHKTLLLSDIHAPYHDAQSLGIALKKGLDAGCDQVLLNGDTLDFYSLSFWEKDPRKRDFSSEREIGVKILETIRNLFPKARIVFKIGNHEERYERYMRVKAPELLNVAEFKISRLFDFERLKIEEVGEKRPIRLGKLNVIHGHEYSFAISNPVNPARGLFLRGKVNAICGHFHQTSSHSERDLEQKVIGCWSTGCLCDIHPEYRPMNNWSHSFAIVETDASGSFNVNLFKILNGEVYQS
jgi:predicted phosphodiesterase